MKTRFVLLAALACLAVASQAQEQLGNGGFSEEKGWFLNSTDAKAVAEYQKAGGRTGGCLHLKSDFADPQAMALARQAIATKPTPGKPIRLTFWAKGKDVSLAIGVVQGLSATHEMASFATSQSTHPLKGTFDWTKVETVLNPNDETKSCAVLLCLAGKGEVWLDDVSFAPIDPSDANQAGLEGPGLVEAHGAFTYTAAAAVGETKVLIPLMLDYREQVPLNYRFTVTPKTALKKTRIYEDRPGNYVAEITLGALKAKDEVEIDWKSLQLVGKRSFAGVPKKAPMPSQWPAEALPWLKSTVSVQAKDPSIQKVAKEIRGSETDVLKIISATMSRTTQIYQNQKGRCTSLDAVQALEKQGSCTSCANLVAALLRANNIPARILAGYPLWSGPLQTHYIVEAYVPSYGWYAIESTQLRERWDPFKQVQVAIIPPEYEDKSGMRAGGFTGVPYLSLTEYADQNVFGLGAVDKEQGCDHEAKRVRVFFEPEEKWAEALKLARERWQAWLMSKPTTLETGKDLSGAKTLDEVIAGMKG